MPLVPPLVPPVLLLLLLVVILLLLESDVSKSRRLCEAATSATAGADAMLVLVWRSVDKDDTTEFMLWGEGGEGEVHLNTVSGTVSELGSVRITGRGIGVGNDG